MKRKEISQVLIAIVILGIVFGFSELIKGKFTEFAIALGASAIILIINIGIKKIIASRLDADVEHELWKMNRYGPAPENHLDKDITAGVLIPLLISIITLGSVKLMTVLTYETRALKRRAAKKFGPYSFTEMTDWHNALVGAAGILSCLLITFVTYWLPGDFWSVIGKMATFYAFFNMIPFSKLDGSQIYFGSRVLWSVLAVITLIFMTYAMLLI
jgi:Zn-dependent protease